MVDAGPGSIRVAPIGLSNTQEAITSDVPKCSRSISLVLALTRFDVSADIPTLNLIELPGFLIMSNVFYSVYCFFTVHLQYGFKMANQPI